MATVPIKTVIANRITLGDDHDKSIQSFLTTTTYPEYRIFRISGEKYRIVGYVPEPIRPHKVEQEKPRIFKRSKKKKKNGK